MFINDKDHTIGDFLTAINFLAPQGMNLKYFIVPYAANTEMLASGAAEGGFTPEATSNMQNVPGVTDTITYAKKDFKSRQSFNDANFNLNQIPNEYPITRQAQTPSNQEPLTTTVVVTGGQIDSPVKGVKVLESTKTYQDVILKEAVGPLPKNTILHFVR